MVSIEANSRLRPPLPIYSSLNHHNLPCTRAIHVKFTSSFTHAHCPSGRVLENSCTCVETITTAANVQCGVVKKVIQCTMCMDTYMYCIFDFCGLVSKHEKLHPQNFITVGGTCQIKPQTLVDGPSMKNLLLKIVSELQFSNSPEAKERKRKQMCFV